MKKVNQKDAEKQITVNPTPKDSDKGSKAEFKITVNEVTIMLYERIVTGAEILHKAGFKHVECHTLYQKFKGCDFEKVSPDEKLDLKTPGVEHFVVKEAEVFYYTVDEEPETSEKKRMTANEILAAAGLDINDYYLVEVFPDHSQRPYKDIPNEPIKLECPGNKFISVFKGETPVS